MLAELRCAVDAVGVDHLINRHVFLCASHGHELFIMRKGNGVNSAFFSGAHDNFNACKVMDNELVSY